MSDGKVYASDIGQAKAAAKLGISKSIVYTWLKMVRLGKFDLGESVHTQKISHDTK